MVIIVSGMLLIVLSADYFTNGVEWLGRALGLKPSAVGTLLAALGTALPETLVPVMAILFGNGNGADGVGLGAILGAPFMLSTLGFLVLGVGLWWFRRPEMTATADARSVQRDLTFFLGSFGTALIATRLPPSIRMIVAAGMVLAYMIFARAVIRGGRAAEAQSPSVLLHLWQHPKPPLWAVLLQVIMALAGLVVGAHYFVEAVIGLARVWQVSGFLLSVILTPVATELPEVLNSVIWLRRRADTLAFGNVTGAMAFQSSLVPALGMWLTPWKFSSLELAIGIISMGATLWLLVSLRRERLSARPLMAAGLFYFLFLGAAFAGLR